ncbi:ThiJ/PfpI family protein [Beauveria brongniartii RCEF 3172]|uniref:ThiJ/PfpI family protein n=1 Tax=Beauveria brongniartii RCEF 3172 TaxID=1081107 RepID=A0A162M3Q6_9HYPO|nr:ThiJ/PfpI family protein [Beauveria brongniartii RCEF 3172]
MSKTLCITSHTHLLNEQGPPTKYAILLFPGFQALDVFGPLDALNTLSAFRHVELSVIAASDSPVSTNFAGIFGTSERVVPTHTLHNAPSDIEVLLVPGGLGYSDVVGLLPVVEFIRNTFPRLRNLLTVCTGSFIAARAGVLDGKNATSNKSAFDLAWLNGPLVNWQRKARWVNDGNIWTSSGVSAGIDMMLAYVSDQYGDDVAEYIAKDMEYVRSKDPSNDPFSGTVGLKNGIFHTFSQNETVVGA